MILVVRRKRAMPMCATNHAQKCDAGLDVFLIISRTCLLQTGAMSDI
jgi:hypothetical protein